MICIQCLKPNIGKMKNCTQDGIFRFSKVNLMQEVEKFQRPKLTEPQNVIDFSGESQQTLRSTDAHDPTDCL